MRRQTVYMKIKNRLSFVVGFMGFLGLIIISYAFYLQIVLGPRYAKKAKKMHEERIELLPKRGGIFDRFLRPLIVEERRRSVYILPQYLKKIPRAVKILNKYGLGTEGEIAKKIRSHKKFFWLKRKINMKTAERLEKDIKKSYLSNAIGFVDEAKRHYPYADTLASVLGFVGSEHKGMYGIEYEYDKLLKGKSGWALYLKNPLGVGYPFPAYPEELPENGKNVFLTIDMDIQKIIYEELSKGVLEWKAKIGYVVVLNPRSGEILGIVDYPDFDPEHFKRYNEERYKLGAISNEFEPGSVFKPLIGASVLEERLAQLTETIPTGPVFIIGKRRIKDVHATDRLSFADVFIHSSNIGAARLALRLGAKNFHNYAVLCGLGSITGISLPGEANGKLMSEGKLTELTLANNGFGQGIALTALQLAQMYTVFANNGVLLRPFIVRGTGVNGIDKERKSFSRRVFSEHVAKVMSEILMDVVEKGTAKGARIKGVEICGKTGTAQKPIRNIGYSSAHLVDSFVGYFPKDSAEILIVVVIEEPNPPAYASQVSVPVFKRIAERILLLPYYRRLKNDL